MAWKWAIDYRLDAFPRRNGQVEPAGQWVPAGTTGTVYAVPDTYYGFGEWTGSVASQANPLSVLMGGPKSVTAWFFELQTENTGTPLVWLAQFAEEGEDDFEELALADPGGAGSVLPL